MKKLLLVCGVSGVLVIGGLAIFITTFDVDRYRQLVVSRLESALGKPVRLERLSLGWHGGMALELRRLAIYADAQAPFDSQGHRTGQAQSEPVVHVEAASAVINPLPLLRKQVQVASIVLSHPRVHVMRDAQGRINVLGLAAIASPVPMLPSPDEEHQRAVSATQLAVPHRDGVATWYGAPPAAASGQTATIGGNSVSFTVASLRIEDGELHWTDAAASPPADLRIKHMDVFLKNVSLTRPVEFHIRMAVLSEQQNLRLIGRLAIPTHDRPGFLEAVRLETDLSHLKSTQLVQALPVLKGLGLQEGLAGQLVVTIERLSLDPKRLGELAGHIRVTKGRIVLARLGSPLDELTVEVVAKDGRVELKRLLTRVANGTVTMTAVVDHLTTQPHTTFQMQMDQIALDALLPSPGPNEPHLRGRLSLILQGVAEGIAWPHHLSSVAEGLPSPSLARNLPNGEKETGPVGQREVVGWPQVTQTLSGSGNLKLTEGAVANLNILRAVFEKLSVIPGLMQRLEARLPEGYQAKFAAKDTILSPIDVSMKLEAGALRFDDLRVHTDTFRLMTAGRVGLDGSVNLRAQLDIEPILSGAIIKGVNELQALTNQDGELEIPLAIQGQTTRLAVLPDLNYVASKVVITKAQDLLSGFLQKALEKSIPPQSTPKP